MRARAILLIVVCTAWAGGPVRAELHAIKLRDGVRLEGSTHHGGLQPSYAIRLADPALRPLFDYARQVRASALPRWTKVARVKAAVRRALPGRAYDAPAYRALLAKHRRDGTSVPIGAYVEHGVGVCRENAILTHLALAEAGIASRMIYVEAKQGERVEDHAVVITPHRGDAYVVDAYNGNFDGARLRSLLGRSGDLRFLRIHAFPRVFSGRGRPPAPR